MSRRRRRLFILLSAFLPVLLVLVAEGAARLAGLGGYPSVLKEIGSVSGGQLVTTYIPGAASYFDQRKTKPGSIAQYVFVTPKARNTTRIVLVGGSAIQGYPQLPGFAPSAFLHAMLSDAWPERRVEVINLGTTAVASFPALDMLTQMLAYEPDLVVIYTGHNEFFGAYGVASLQTGGASPGAIRLQRWIGGLGLVQLVRKIAPGPQQRQGALMEAMVGESYIAPDDPRREAAARNLKTHIGEMLRRCARRGVPAIVCTLAANERDLAPVGIADLAGLTTADRLKVETRQARGLALLDTDPGRAADEFRAALQVYPDHARVHYYLGKAYYALAQHREALKHFQRAIDVDPMPWRVISGSLDAIRAAAREHDVPLCDVAEAFREESPGGCVGWNLMDDHVHPSLKGQALIARTIVKTLTKLEGPLRVTNEAYEELPAFESYSRRLGANIYEEYAVAHNLRLVYAVPFMRRSNPEGYARTDAWCKRLIQRMPPAIRPIAQEWQDPKLHSIVRRPLSGMAARGLMRESKYYEAERLLETARRCVPLYSTWNAEYTYFMLACREKLRGALEEADRQIAAEAIARIDFMLRHGVGNPGMVQRFKGRLHQLRQEWAESIAPLQQARKYLWEMDKVACDIALVEAYVKTEDLRAARDLAQEGASRSGKFADYYRRLLSTIPSER